jgi:membrane protein YqaA with SNARE-associated domain
VSPAWGIAAGTLLSEDGALALAAGAWASGRWSFESAFLGAWLGITVGDWGLYALGRALGPVLERYAWFRSGRWQAVAQRWGVGSPAFVALARLLPGARLPGYTAAGILRTAWWPFALSVAVSAFVWVGSGGGGRGSGAAGTGSDAPPIESFVIAVSDETTALAAGVSKRSFFVPYNFQITELIASLTTPQTSGTTFTVDLNHNGASILSTKLTIDNTSESSLNAVSQYVLSQSQLSKSVKMTVDIDQIGDGTAKGLVVTLIGYRLG